MNWYDAFNAIEAGLWASVALVIPCRFAANGLQQRAAVVLASVSFLAFGVADLLELGRDGLLPLWLWVTKIGCGGAILAARYTWIGWNRFRWRDREMVLGWVVSRRWAS
jgi:hypothetical protein